MVTIIIIVLSFIGVYLFIKQWSKSLPKKRLEKEIYLLEAELGDLTVSELKKDSRQRSLETKIRRLKALYQEKESER